MKFEFSKKIIHNKFKYFNPRAQSMNFASGRWPNRDNKKLRHFIYYFYGETEAGFQYYYELWKSVYLK